jgi:hypothetical protein
LSGRLQPAFPLRWSQEREADAYILNRPGCAAHDIKRCAFVESPFGRVAESRNKGIAIKVIGEKKYAGTHALMGCAINAPVTRVVTKVELTDGVAIARHVQILI